MHSHAWLFANCALSNWSIRELVHVKNSIRENKISKQRHHINILKNMQENESLCIFWLKIQGCWSSPWIQHWPWVHNPNSFDLAAPQCITYQFDFQSNCIFCTINRPLIFVKQKCNECIGLWIYMFMFGVGLVLYCSLNLISSSRKSRDEGIEGKACCTIPSNNSRIELLPLKNSRIAQLDNVQFANWPMSKGSNFRPAHGCLSWKGGYARGEICVPGSSQRCVP